MRVALLLIVGLAACGRLGFDRASGDAAAGGGDDADGSASDAPADVAITPGTMTVGFTQVGASSQNSSTNRLWMSKFTLPQVGTLQRLVAYVGVGGGQGSNARAVVYADAGGTPTSLVLGTATVALPAQAADAWVSFPVSPATQLAAGDYWLGIQNDTALRIAYQVTIGSTKNTTDTFADGADAVYAGGTQTFTMQLSIYGEYLP